MAIYADSVNYVDSVAHAAVAQWQATHAYAAGALIRPLTAPATNSERVYVCIVAGTSSGTEPATWTATRGAKVTDGATVIWQECTGLAGLNGDLTNVATWAQLKAVTTPLLGAVIQRNSGGSLQICSTAGTMAVAEPAFSNTAGVTTADGTSTWTSLGAPSNYAAWAAPHARLQNATTTTWNPFGASPASLNTAVSSATIYVGDDHAETQGSAMTITPILAATGLLRILCVDHTKVPPYASGDLKTTATITTTGAFTLNITGLAGSIYFYGLTFSGGSGAVANGLSFTPINALYYFDNCVLKKPGTSGINGSINMNGAQAGRMVWNNCTVFFGSVTDSISIDTQEFTWQNTPGGILAASSAIPTRLMGSSAAGRYNNIILEGLDMNGLTSTTINSQNASTQMGNWVIKDCKLNSGMTVLAIAATNQNIQFVGSDTGATAYKSSRYTFEGTETTETSITRVGGAVDPAGQAQSRKYVPASNVFWNRPFRAEPFAIWNSRTAANVVVTVYGTWESGSTPNNDEIWIEVEYLGTSGFPLGVFDFSSTKSNVFATASALTTDSSTWNGGGSGGGWSPFKFVVTLSSPQPQFAGLIWVRPRVARTSGTFYLDPKIELS